MAYNGQIITMPVGTGGLLTDMNQSRIPITSLILTNNVTVRNDIVEKDPGSRRWNAVALPTGVVAAYDFWPNDITQRLIVITRDGTVTKYLDPHTPVTLKTGLTISDSPTLVAGGAESGGRARKLFIFTGNNPVQVLTGDANTLTPLASPAADWTTSYPTTAVIHRSRLCAMGNASSPHTFYMSDDDDHEQFTSGGFTFPVSPGEGEALFNAYVFKGRAFLTKYPEGVYYLDDTDADFVNWSMRKLTSSFGAASRHCAVEVLNDLIIANSTGSLTSAQATQSFGAIESGDILNALKNERFMRQNMSQDGRKERHAIYYENKKLALFTYRSSGGVRNDRILTLDFNHSTARVTWADKDQANCLFLKKDTLRIERPFYGSEDGYVYEMDRADRDVGGNAYVGEFQTPHTDFGFADPGFAERMKLYDFLEVTFEETGNWSLSVDVIIDKEYVETINFTLTKNEYLNNFILNTDDVVGTTPQSFRLPLHGTGRRISFRCYNGGLRQNFRISALTVYFRIAGDNQGAFTK